MALDPIAEQLALFEIETKAILQNDNVVPHQVVKCTDTYPTNVTFPVILPPVSDRLKN